MIDLHMHTIYSDGSKTVKEILKMCEEKKLEYISITDHNTCEAYYDQDMLNNNTFNGTIIKGCELNAGFQNRAIEILGYKINTDIIMKWREKYYSEEQMNKNTKLIYNRLLKILDEQGVVYNEEDIRPQKNTKELIEKPIWEEIVKHPENKEVIGEDCFNTTRAFYRKKVTNPNSEYFLNRVETFPTVKEAVDTIHKAGGMAFLAHPFEYKFENTIEFIEDLINETNLDGVECFHPSANEEQMQILVKFCKDNNLYISGGSDYHGKLKPDIQIGEGKGNLRISKDFVEDWI